MRPITLLIAFLITSLTAGLLVTARASAAVRDLPADAERLYNGGLYRQAAEALNASIQRAPGESSLHYWLGRCLYELRDYNHAISSFERAVIIEPDLSEYHDWLGKAYGRKAEEINRFSAFSSISLAHKAHREFEAAVRLDARNLEAQRDLIRYLMNAPAIVGGSQGVAEQHVHALAAMDPVEGALAQAELYASHKKFDEAGQEYQKILDMMPSRIGVYFEIAEYYRDRGDAKHMSEAVEEGAALAPADHRLDYYRGIALVLAGQDDADAEKDLRHYLDTVPDNANVPSHSTAHEWLGKLYQKQGQLDRAAMEYQAALISDPRNRQANDALKALQRRR